MIAAILPPARDALQSSHPRVREKGDSARAWLVLDADAVHKLEGLPARQEVLASVATVTLLGLFIAALIHGVFA